MLSSAAHAMTTPSEVCGKPEIRTYLAMDTKDVSEQTWQNVKNTAQSQLEEMEKTEVKLTQELSDLNAKVTAKGLENTLSSLTTEESKVLIQSIFGDGSFASAEEAKSIDCGYDDEAEEYSQDKDYEQLFENSVVVFEQKANAALEGTGSSISREVFQDSCYDLIGASDTMCGTLCDDLTNVAAGIKVTSNAVIGGLTKEELIQLATEKRGELDRAKAVLEECRQSIEPINELVRQFMEASATVTLQRKSCGKAKRSLKMLEMKLKKVKKEFEEKTIADEEARKAFEQALDDEAVAKEEKEMAEEYLKTWQAELKVIEEQIAQTEIEVAKTEKALSRANDASAAVTDFKDKLATALLGLVTYYDEAVRQPMRNMGIRDDVNINMLFPKPTDTDAAKNLKQNLDATNSFCENRIEDFEKLPEIVVSDTQLTAICKSQKWDTVSGEVEAIVSTRQKKTISNLKTAQKKVVPYSGVLADKAAGEVEGVWMAMALFGDTGFSKNYLSGWRFDKNGESKGGKAGFMMELAVALKTTREKAEDNWKKALQKLKDLEVSKEQVLGILETAKEMLEEAIKLYDAAVENRQEKQEKAKEARKALELVTARKIELEKACSDATSDLDGKDALLKDADEALKNTHTVAMQSFMELLHASEQQEGESWD